MRHGEWRADVPPNRATVLVTVTDGIRPRVCEATWYAEEEVWHMSGGHRERKDVSAWMPLPEPFMGSRDARVNPVSEVVSPVDSLIITRRNRVAETCRDPAVVAQNAESVRRAVREDSDDRGVDLLEEEVARLNRIETLACAVADAWTDRPGEPWQENAMRGGLRESLRRELNALEVETRGSLLRKVSGNQQRGAP